MELFESLLGLLAVAVILLQTSRGLRTPYPSMLAVAGVAVAFVPFAPEITMDPQLALALFIAPALLDVGYDVAPRELRRNWLPLASLVLVAVSLTTAAVAWAGWKFAGLPIAAAITLGAIVAPPDAAAAAAVLQRFRLPRRTLSILQGESLLNDAVALLIFGAALSVAVATPETKTSLWGHLLIAVPGGWAIGWGIGHAYLFGARRVAGTMSSIILEFVSTFGTWLVAEKLGLSPIIAVVVFAMTVAARAPEQQPARDRIHSYSIWGAVVFILNVLAFLLMGLQARVIFARLHGQELMRALEFAGLVLLIVVVVRLAWLMIYGLLMRRFEHPLRNMGVDVPIPSARIGILVSWCGMRGLVTLATAFALPQNFPQRDVVLLSAFAVVLGTLVVQGLTIGPLIRLLNIEPDRSREAEISFARTRMLDAAMEALADKPGPAADTVRTEYRAAQDIARDTEHPQRGVEHDRLRMIAIAEERRVLFELRNAGEIEDDAFHAIEEQLDWAELNASPAGHFPMQAT
ncbi:sodium:proton antiporter [soil metagenome]